jgi:hypothetical protein
VWWNGEVEDGFILLSKTWFAPEVVHTSAGTAVMDALDMLCCY